MSTERTFIAIKPDGVQRGLVGKIIKRFEQRGFKLVAMKLCKPGKEHLEKHYADLSSKVDSNSIYSCATRQYGHVRFKPRHDYSSIYITFTFQSFHVMH